MDREYVDCVVIGAGVTGLAIARALALKKRNPLLLEKTMRVGTGISSRNSEVIHAGIYYPKDFLKTKLCVKGKEQLYEYAAERYIPHKTCCKLIVATNEQQIDFLKKVKDEATAKGVHNLKLLSKSDVLALEPSLNCSAALLSPSTGIIDSHHFMLTLQGDIENSGGQCVFSSYVYAATIEEGAIALHVKSSNSDVILVAKTVINAAGLEAVPLMHRIKNFPKDRIPTQYYAKGSYFTLTANNPFRHLIYPVPEKAGLGIHLTLDLSMKARFGPDVEWVKEINYNVDHKKADHFYEAIRHYWPGLPDGSLAPDYAGIRPKLHGPDQKITDFLIQSPRDHGIPGLVNLCGIESPGLTASLAIADYVSNMV